MNSVACNPSFTDESAPMKLAIFKRCILWIDISAVQKYSCEYLKDEFYFYYTSDKDEATLLITENKLKVDGLIISPNFKAADIILIKELTSQRAIPFMLYTYVFDEKAKNLAIEMGVDDYYTGDISYSFSKKLEFLRRFKQYKNSVKNVREAMVRKNTLSTRIGVLIKKVFDFVCSPLQSFYTLLYY
jgi:PleD family two-component response regulator